MQVFFVLSIPKIIISGDLREIRIFTYFVEKLVEEKRISCISD